MTPIASERAGSYRRTMELTYDILHAVEPKSSLAGVVRPFTAGLIVLNVIAVMLESVQSIEASFGRELHLFDMVSVAIFSIEYLLRLWSSPVGRPEHPPLLARLRYAFSFFGMVDLLAVAPFYLHTLFVTDLRVVRGLRLLRLERLLLLGRYSKGLRMLGRAVSRTRSELYASFAVIAMMLLISSTVVYYLEHEAQPDKFANIPESLWWGVITLTSVGYGDVYPTTAVGRLFGGIIALLGLGLAALPSGLIASGFVAEFKEEKEALEDPEGHVRCPACGHAFKVDESVAIAAPAAGVPAPATATAAATAPATAATP